MRKLKSNRGIIKRFKITKTGKLLRYKGGKSHILEKKSSSRKRKLGRSVVVNKTYTKKIKRLISR